MLLALGASSRPAGETSDGLARLKAGAQKTQQIDLSGITVKTLGIGENIKLGDIGSISVDRSPAVEFFKGENPAIITSRQRVRG